MSGVYSVAILEVAGDHYHASHYVGVDATIEISYPII
jgi:hypothetical protein